MKGITTEGAVPNEQLLLNIRDQKTALETAQRIIAGAEYIPACGGLAGENDTE